MIYYNSRYLSHKLQINLAKWKRWVREFLPPDPLGGMQSGVTRQFNTKDAFKVYLGGYLVGTLKFTIPDASIIIADLSPWLKTHGFFQIHARLPLNGANHMPRYYLFLYPRPGQSFLCNIRTMMSSEMIDAQNHIVQETFSQTQCGKSSNDADGSGLMCGFMIALTTLYTAFLKKIVSTK